VLNYASGEEWLLAVSPVFKRRYAHDGDLLLGCTIGCVFCYYRWISASRRYIGTGRLKRLATPEEMVSFLKGSRLFLPKDIIILGARGDASMYLNEMLEFTKLFHEDHFFGDNLVLALHRAPVNRFIEEAMEYPRFRFGTTVTPKAYSLKWTSVREEDQLRGLKCLAEKGFDTGRVSIEVGPLNSLNFEDGMKVIERIADLGYRHVVVRGSSFGSFGVDREAELKKMLDLKFVTKEAVEQAREKHEYYVVKNFLTPEAYRLIQDRFPDVNVHRHTYTLYHGVWNVPIAGNRDNMVRVCFPLKHSVGHVRKTVEKYGILVDDVEERGDHYFVKVGGIQPVTEDIAMTVGAELEAAVVFDKFRRTAAVEDVHFYRKHSLFHLNQYLVRG
jgi:DNA repair photolyase